MPRILILLALATVAAFSQNPAEKEAVMGNGLAADLDSRVKPLADPEVAALVERVLKAVSNGQALRMPVRLKILDTSEPVASALPGGFLLLSPGAIVRANTEAELAALIAHALAHMQPEPTGTVRFLSAWGECRRSGTELLAPGSVLDQARGSEAQADMLALDYLVQSPYDVSALTAVYERWGGRFPPDETVRARARSLAQTGAMVNTSDFGKIKTRLTPPPARPPTLYQK
jgi:predicted Zn-dependent protease